MDMVLSWEEEEEREHRQSTFFLFLTQLDKPLPPTPEPLRQQAGCKGHLMEEIPHG